MPMRLMDSTPPPIVMSCWPDITCGGGEIHRVEARGAEAVDLHARDRVAVARMQRRGARDVAAGFADRIDAAEHHIVDQFGVELVAVAERRQRAGGEARGRCTSCSEPSCLPRPRGVRTWS